MLIKAREFWEVEKVRIQKEHEETLKSYGADYEEERKRLLVQWEKYREETEAENKRKLDATERSWRRDVQEITVSIDRPSDENYFKRMFLAWMIS